MLNVEDCGPAMHGHGLHVAERYLEQSKRAEAAEEKVKFLTGAVEALLLHFQHLKSEADVAGSRIEPPPTSA